MKQELNHPWMIALWPGMGHVAINAGYYMMAKLAMHLESELNARELFEVDRVEVDRGIIRCARLPRSRFFVWHDPKEERDLVVFLGEAQPPSGAYAYCRRIIDHAQALGVERVFTFAAMATQMQLDDESRVFGAATGEGILEECRELGLEVLEEGQISGLNGVLLGVAAERGLNGACLLGEMPHSFTQVPFPKASLAVLEAFGPLAGLSLDLTELEEESEAMEAKLRALMEKIEDAIRTQQGGAETTSFGPPLEPEEEAPGLDAKDRNRIEELFALARGNRPQAYQLKQELDRLGAFEEYEDRFLDLFRDTEAPGE